LKEALKQNDFSQVQKLCAKLNSLNCEFSYENQFSLSKI